MPNVTNRSQSESKSHTDPLKTRGKIPKSPSTVMEAKKHNSYWEKGQPFLQVEHITVSIQAKSQSLKSKWLAMYVHVKDVVLNMQNKNRVQRSTSLWNRPGFFLNFCVSQDLDENHSNFSYDEETLQLNHLGCAKLHWEQVSCTAVKRSGVSIEFE